MKIIQKELTAVDTVLLIARLIVSVAILVTGMLGLFEIWEDAGYLYVPSIGILMLIQTIEEWKKHRAIAIVSLCAAVFIFGCFIVELFII